jgi:MOSC domain-containing protein YiiM
MPGRIISINTSGGGVPKLGRRQAFVGPNGLEGDRQRFSFHGGSDRAVVLYAVEVIEALQAEGHCIDVGTTGENLTVGGLDWPSIIPGTELEIGEVRLLVTKYASPCEQIRESFFDRDVSRISQKRHPGSSRVCARVIAAGVVHIGDAIVVRPSASHGRS